MTSQITFYFSQIVGKKVLSDQNVFLGKIKDFLIDQTPIAGKEHEQIRPRVIALRMRTGKGTRILDFSTFEIKKFKRNLRITCHGVHEIIPEHFPHCLWLGENILDKQIVDINGCKLVRVNDIRLVGIPSGTYAIAVDVGIDGLLRRIGIDRPIQSLLDPLRIDIPGKFILWDDIEAVDFTNSNIKLSKATSKLNTLHPSDLADIIEDLDRESRAFVFSFLDEEKAADVLEELEPKAQIQIVESLPVEKMADVLEKMPADEVADLLDVLEDDKAEKLLNEMEKESSEEVRELLEYDDKYVGSLMTTDFMVFHENQTVGEIIETMRRQKPEPSHIYSIFVTDKNDRFLSVVSLGELVITSPEKRLNEFMIKDAVTVYDNDKVDSLAELVSKYNLLAVPVINKEQKMEGVVVVEDIVDDLLSRRKTK